MFSNCQCATEHHLFFVEQSKTEKLGSNKTRKLMANLWVIRVCFIGAFPGYLNCNFRNMGQKTEGFSILPSLTEE